MQFTGCDQPVQHSRWLENAIELAAIMVMRFVMRHARTPKFQLSGPTVHSLYCDTINVHSNVHRSYIIEEINERKSFIIFQQKEKAS